MSERELVLIIDFGSPYNQLLTRKVRELGVYSELHPHTIAKEEIKRLNPKAIILSGGPYYVKDENRFQVEKEIYQLGVPILGICYGMQLIVDHFGGTIVQEADRDYEQSTVQFAKTSDLNLDLPATHNVWLSKGTPVDTLTDALTVEAKDKAGNVVALRHATKPIYGMQFYPEVDETEHGLELLKNFLFTISECHGDWSIERFMKEEIKRIRKVVGDEQVLCGLSGGVDSSVVATLIHKAIGDQLTCIFVDHGLLRKNEAKEVMELLAGDLHMNIVQVDASERFFSKLEGIEDPEEKRKIIGNEFVEVFDEEAKKLTDVRFLAQGTLYSDVLESGTLTGQKVKSHHNVGGLPEEMNLELLEPIRSLFKDEVRALGTALGLQSEQLFDILKVSYGDSRMLRRHMEHYVLDRQFEPGGAVKYVHKDVKLANELMTEAGLPKYTGNMAEEAFQIAIDKGLANEDMSAVIKPLEKQSGTIVKK